VNVLLCNTEAQKATSLMQERRQKHGGAVLFVWGKITEERMY
jgi:hypothetical protein